MQSKHTPEVAAPLAPVTSAHLASHSSLSRVLLSLFHCRLDPAHVLATKCGSHFRKHLPAALSASNPALSAILAAVQRAWVASALAGAAALCSSADVERANAPSPSRSQSLSSCRFECASVRMLRGLLINNAPATRNGRCRTGASRVYRYQDGESLIRIADRDSDRCKPITSST